MFNNEAVVQPHIIYIIKDHTGKSLIKYSIAIVIFGSFRFLAIGNYLWLAHYCMHFLVYQLAKVKRGRLLVSRC